jgi:hypothetical protein
MRLAALITLVVGLAASATTAMAAGGRSGLLEIVNGRGIVQITGKGGLNGRIVRGSLQITDLSPGDEWSPWVNGLPRGKTVSIRGENVTFRLGDGRYQIVARGEGISISGNGTGQAILDGEPDAVGVTGSYQVGDRPPQALPSGVIRVSFGGKEPKKDPRTSGPSGKIKP